MKTLCVVLCALALTACGENRGHRTEQLYGPDAYRIAGDTTPSSNPPWKGNEHAWQIQIDNRARMQNEYTRTR